VDTDRNLLFGVLALQADLMTAAQFAQACSAGAAAKDTPLADLLVERGWLTAGDRADVDKFLQRKLQKHRGDARASLAEVVTDPVRQSLAGQADPDVHASIAPPTPPPTGHVLLATTAYLPEGRQRYTFSRLHATGGIGPVEVKQPRVQDRRPADQREKFTSAILPPYLQKTKSIEELIPWL
jgi:hypothetical protein